MPFQPGDRVVYPSQGAGVVQEITSREVLGETQAYLKIVFVRGDMEVLVPLQKGREVGLRTTVGTDELARLEHAMAAGDLNLPQQWPPRYRAEQEIVGGGDAYQLAKLIGVLAKRDLEKGLAATERDVMEAAKALLASEFAIVADTDLKTAHARLDAVLRERVP
ncbi:MAG: CarD family transcriptional regulator [Trueperaceae bacterium]